MALKLIDGEFTETHTLKVYRDSEWEEFRAVVRCKANNAIVSSYHTDDKEDAKQTGRTILTNATAANATSLDW